MRFLLLAAAAVALVGTAQAQISLGSAAVDLDFNDFRGTGFTPTPGPGQLDSDTYDVVRPVSPGGSTFGDTQVSGPFARGASAGNVTTSGVYAFEVAPGDYAFGIQPGLDFFGPQPTDTTPGSAGFVHIRFENNTGQTLRSMSLQGEFKVLNNSNGATGFTAGILPDVVISASGVELSRGSPVTAGQAVTTPTANPSATWATARFASTSEGFEISPGETFYVRVFIGDAGGPYSERDEVAFDDISVAAFAQTIGSSFGEASENVAGWRMLSPIVSGSTIADLRDDNAVFGVAGSFPNEAPNLFLTYAGSGGLDGFGNVDGVSTATPLESGKGILWYFSNTDDETSDRLPDNVDYSGTVQTTDVTALFDVNDGGVYFGGNPFNRAFALSGLTAPAGFVVSDAVNVWAPAAGPAAAGGRKPGSYRTLSRSQGAVVARGQGFLAEMVAQPDGAGSLALTYSASAQTDNAVPFIGRVGQMLRSGFTLSGLAPSGATTFDEAAYLVFDDTAADALDAFDGSKARSLASPSAELAFVGTRDGAPHYRAQEARPTPAPSETVVLPMATRVLGEGGTYVLRWPGLDALPEDWPAELEDLTTGQRINLRASDEYTFASGITGGTEDWDERFVLRITEGTEVAGENNAPAEASVRALYPNPVSGSAAARLVLATPTAEPVTVSVYDAVGRLVEVSFDGTTAGGAETQVELPTGLAPGVYVVRIAGTSFATARRLTVLR